jgi:DNA-binding transcriptional regulator/RsmH inhibitor MraZ
MPSNDYRAPFVPEPIGVGDISVDKQGRVAVPTSFRAIFAPQTPPFDVILSLVNRGCLTIYAADVWPPRAERESIQPPLQLAGQVRPETLPSDHLAMAQEFFRIVACRYLLDQVALGWKLKLPRAVRAWLGLREPPGQATSVIVVGNFGALELWDSRAFKDALPEQHERIDALSTRVHAALVHARGRTAELLQGPADGVPGGGPSI